MATKHKNKQMTNKIVNNWYLHSKELHAVFIRKQLFELKKQTQLSCRHCGGKATPITNWCSQIRSKCLKKGLNKDTPIPKTCDKMAINNKRNNIINNKYYSQIYKLIKIHQGEISEIVQRRKDEFKTNYNIEIKPKKYLITKNI